MKVYSHIKIEDGIPIPPDKPRGGKMDVLRRMQPGQSALFPAAAKTLQMQLSAAGRVLGQRMKDGRRYVTRKVDGGYRVWRIE